MTKDDIVRLALSELRVRDLIESPAPEHTEHALIYTLATLDQGRAEGYVWWDSVDDDSLTEAVAINLAVIVASRLANHFFGAAIDDGAAIMRLYNLNPNKIYVSKIKRPL